MNRQATASALALLALASCGAFKQPYTVRHAGKVDQEIARLPLTSDAFRDGQPIPQLYSCDGGNRSPALQWSDPPQGALSFALVIDDPDAPRGMFRHWGVYDIPASARGIAAGQHVGTEVNNDAGKPGYTGPCPPKGNGVHHYHFKLFALDVPRLGLGARSSVADVEQAATAHAIAQSELIGTYERK